MTKSGFKYMQDREKNGKMGQESTLTCSGFLFLLALVIVCVAAIICYD